MQCLSLVIGRKVTTRPSEHKDFSAYLTIPQPAPAGGPPGEKLYSSCIQHFKALKKGTLGNVEL